MKAFVKPAIVLGMAGAMALGSMTASQARVRPWAAGAAGFAAGAVIGAAAANSAYYGPRYYTPGYAAYGYAPGYDSYGYQPGYNSYSYGPSYEYNDVGVSRPRWEERRLKGID
ncbi:MAG: hypothetical protein J0I13_02950 [Rhizobiales bacterium]|jgi:hypothetical protein|nr:hypothetical protein [Hyphomicrobiales bacterium]